MNKKEVYDTDFITFEHIEWFEVDINRLLTEDYPTAHIDLTILLVQKNYQRYMTEIERSENGKISEHMKERALMYSKLDAQNWLMHHGVELIERSTAFLIEEAERTGWFRNDYFGWDTLEDMLSNIIDAQEVGTSNAWYWSTFAKKVVPAAQKIGVSPGQLLSTSAQARKMHSLVTAYNTIERNMNNDTMTLEEGEETFLEFVGLCSNPAVTSPEFNKTVKEWRGKEIEEPEALDGFNIILADGRTIVLIETETRVHNQMITNALRNKVNLQDIGIKEAIKLLSALLKVDYLMEG